MQNESTPDANGTRNNIHNLPRAGSVSPSPSSLKSPMKTKAMDFENKGSFSCYFCMGKGCYYENWKNNPDPAIRGLNSDFITPSLIASQRLSNRLIAEFDLMKQFKAYVSLPAHACASSMKIKAVINVEEPGEHPKCGDGIDPRTGFSYDPEILQRSSPRSLTPG